MQLYPLVSTECSLSWQTTRSLPFHSHILYCLFNILLGDTLCDVQGLHLALQSDIYSSIFTPHWTKVEKLRAKSSLATFKKSNLFTELLLWPLLSHTFKWKEYIVWSIYLGRTGTFSKNFISRIVVIESLLKGLQGQIGSHQAYILQ